MLKIFIKDLELGDLTPDQLLKELTELYGQLREAASRCNDLRTFLSAELTLATLSTAQHALAQPQCYHEQAHYLKAEPTDAVDLLWTERLRYVSNSWF